jgi:O-antigen/teichoic acid export membrane protein
MDHLSRKYLRNTWVNMGFQKYFRNTSWMLGARILSMGISFLATTYIARHLGPTNFGQLSYAVSFVGLFGFISSLGIGSILYRDLIRYPERKFTLLGTSFVLNLIAGISTAFLCGLIAIVFSQDDVSKILIFILAGTFIANAFQLPLFDFQARADSKYPSIISIAVTIILNILKLMIIASGKGVIYLAFVLLLESILYASCYIFAYHARTSDRISMWSFDKAYALTLLKDCLPLIMLSAFSMIYSRIDQVFIKHMIDARSVGLYDASVRLSEVWTFIPVILTTSLYPAIVNAKKLSETIYTERLAKLALTFFAMSLVIAVPMSLFAPLIISLLYGPTFMAGVGVLKIYIWSNVGLFLGTLINQYLITENYRVILSLIAFIPMAINVTLNILWIPIYGIEGAAYATLISYSCTPLMLLLFRKTRVKVYELMHAL